MLIRDLQQCDQFIAGDKTILRELLHPAKADIKLGYSLAHATVKPGQTSQPHTLKTTEVYYILEGQGIMHIGPGTVRRERCQVPFLGRQGSHITLSRLNCLTVASTHCAEPYGRFLLTATEYARPSSETPID